MKGSGGVYKTMITDPIKYIQIGAISLILALIIGLVYNRILALDRLLKRRRFENEKTKKI